MLFIYLGFYVAFNTVQIISRRVVGRTEETSTYSSSGFCTVKCQPTASNYQLSHLRPCREPNPDLRGGRRECYHSATVAPEFMFIEYYAFEYGYLKKGGYVIGGNCLFLCYYFEIEICRSMLISPFVCMFVSTF